jgi:UDP-N-acetyl-D-glucosamine dehydrogenase
VAVEPIAALRDTFLRRIDAHEVYIGIIGQGYVGLPLALTFVEKGFRVLGFDVDAEKVAALNRRR